MQFIRGLSATTPPFRPPAAAPCPSPSSPAGQALAPQLHHHAEATVIAHAPLGASSASGWTSRPRLGSGSSGSSRYASSHRPPAASPRSQDMPGHSASPHHANSSDDEGPSTSGQPGGVPLPEVGYITSTANTYVKHLVKLRTSARYRREQQRQVSPLLGSPNLKCGAGGALSTSLGLSSPPPPPSALPPPLHGLARRGG